MATEYIDRNGRLHSSTNCLFGIEDWADIIVSTVGDIQTVRYRDGNGKLVCAYEGTPKYYLWKEESRKAVLRLCGKLGEEMRIPVEKEILYTCRIY